MGILRMPSLSTRHNGQISMEMGMETTPEEGWLMLSQMTPHSGLMGMEMDWVTIKVDRILIHPFTIQTMMDTSTATTPCHYSPPQATRILMASRMESIGPQKTAMNGKIRMEMESVTMPTSMMMATDGMIGKKCAPIPTHTIRMTSRWKVGNSASPIALP